MMSHPAMSLGDRFCDSRRAGQGEVGGCIWKVQTALAVSGLRNRKALVGTGRAISAIFGINGIRK